MRPPDLERTGALRAFGLDEKTAAEGFVDVGVFQQRRPRHQPGQGTTGGADFNDPDRVPLGLGSGGDDGDGPLLAEVEPASRDAA